MLIDKEKHYNLAREEHNLGFFCQNNNKKTMTSKSYVR
jgi:hypothetical protein